MLLYNQICIYIYIHIYIYIYIYTYIYIYIYDLDVNEKTYLPYGGAPSCRPLPKPAKKQCKIQIRRPVQAWCPRRRFWHVFYAIFGISERFASQDDPRWPQYFGKITQDGPDIVQDDSKMAQHGPKMACKI